MSSTKRIVLTFTSHGKAIGCVIDGVPSNIELNEQDASYFKTRPRNSQIGAWSSNQSDDLSSRDELVKNIKDFEMKYKDKDIPRPSHWNGYLVMPNLIEFWQEMPFRVHERVLYFKSNNSWKIKKLYPKTILHMIGPLQTNKVKDAIKIFDIIETVDREKVAIELKKNMDKYNFFPQLYV